MKKETKLKLAAGIGLISAVLLCLVGCSAPDAAEVAAKYTDEVAKAVIESGWHIATAVVIAGFISGILSS